jgi:hypothetical protein
MTLNLENHMRASPLKVLGLAAASLVLATSNADAQGKDKHKDKDKDKKHEHHEAVRAPEPRHEPHHEVVRATEPQHEVVRPVDPRREVVRAVDPRREGQVVRAEDPRRPAVYYPGTDPRRADTRDARRVPPGLSRKPGNMPPGQYKKLHHNTHDGAVVLGDVLHRHGYTVVRTADAGDSRFVYYRLRDGQVHRALVSPGTERLRFANVPGTILSEVMSRLY